MEEYTLEHFRRHEKDSPVSFQLVCVFCPYRNTVTDYVLQEIENEKWACHWCQIWEFKLQPTLPISIRNDIDNTVINPDFRFCERSVLREGCEEAEAGFRSGCNCIHDDNCALGACHCLQEVDIDDSDAAEDPSERASKVAIAYYIKGSKKGLLRSRYLDSRNPIYECHEGCECSENCPNRVVARGRTVPLDIFRTTDRGWGARDSQATYASSSFLLETIG